MEIKTEITYVDRKTGECLTRRKTFANYALLREHLSMVVDSFWRGCSSRRVDRLVIDVEYTKVEQLEFF